MGASLDFFVNVAAEMRQKLATYYVIQIKIRVIVLKKVHTYIHTLPTYIFSIQENEK